MTLATGTRIGPYEILSTLGAGGMGEVYRARDTRLGREVALKALPVETAANAQRLKRFEKEARAASALNHPNIVAIYDVGTTDGVSWFSMERVEGQTLRTLLDDGALPVRKLAGWATQIADGLARAHAIGIVHRDLKPENVMVTKDGVVKILDFGLAKLTGPEPEGEKLAEATTLSAFTEAGVVLGTVPYMSPEQARGEPLDFRSDQFALGSILYEMATDRRAFARRSGPETMAAIIHDEPEALGTAAPRTPLLLRWIVERCLAKDPEERYASTRDLARDLARLRDGASEGNLTEAAIAGPSLRRGRRLAAAAALAALAAGAILGVALARAPGTAPLVWRPLTFRRGAVGNARFAPDGKTVVYAAAWQGRPAQLYTTRLDSTESTALPLPSANLASISGAGKLAIQVSRDPRTHVIAEVSLAGGAPRELVEGEAGGVLPLAEPAADWAPGTDHLAVTRGGNLEFPIGKVLVAASGDESVRAPRFSPDGRRIAYIQRRAELDAVCVVDLDGNRKILSDGYQFVPSLAWHPGTGEIWFSAREPNSRFGVQELKAVSLSGKRRVVARTPTLLIIEDIARDGGVLLRSDDWPTTMMCLPPASSREVDLTWLDASDSLGLSDDGQDLLFSESGAGAGVIGAIYLRKTDGASPAVRLGEGGGAQALSPDKKWVVQVLLDRLVLLPVGPGESKTFQDSGLQYRTAAFFPDGKRLLIEASVAGHGPRLYVRDVFGGPPRPFTPEGFRAGPLSPDGKFVAARDAGEQWVLCPVEGGEPQPLHGVARHEFVIRFDAKGEALFVAAAGPVLPLRVDRFHLASGKRSLWKEIALADPTGVGEITQLQLTPDGACYCYSFMRALSRLYVVEGLR